MKPTTAIAKAAASQNVAWPSRYAVASTRLYTPETAAKALCQAAHRPTRGPGHLSRPQRRSHSPFANRRYATERAPAPTSSLITTSALPNGVRVATEATPGHFSAVGVYIDTGSRYERPWVPGESGVSHLLDRMAFKSTANRSSVEMTAEIEKLGGSVMCNSSRETIMYQSSMFNQDLPAVLSILADTIQHPLILEEELDAQKEAAAWEISEIWNKPEMILPELLHMVAYKDNTLGNPLLCPMESLQRMSVDNLRSFIKTWYKPERIVVAGAGMPHHTLEEMTRDLFGSTQHDQSVLDESKASLSHGGKSSISSKSSPIFGGKPPGPSQKSPLNSADFSTARANQASHAGPSAKDLAHATAKYTGGSLYLPRNDLPFTHIYVAFEGVSIHSNDIYALATLQLLLGGGSSFSAGGPGKGMYTRLYNVLNTHHSVDFCSSFLHSYNDSALFGIAAACEHWFVPQMGHVIAQQLEHCCGTGGGRRSDSRFGTAGSLTNAELARARNQLKSSLMMALESRLVEVEDLGRQVQVHGKKVSVEEMCAKIDEVDMAALHRVANRVLRPQMESDNSESPGKDAIRGSREATVVATGQLDGLGDVRQLLHARGLGAKPTSDLVVQDAVLGQS